MARPSAALLALIVGQVCVHATMAGTRLGLPLQALREGHAEWLAGVLLALFALPPIALALPAGRLADRHGYHRPMRLAVALTAGGAALAALGALLPAGWGGARLAAMALAAVGCGAGANIGLIAIQRTAGRSASSPTEVKQVFAWLGLAPAFANVVGPVLAGVLIDAGGFPAAYGAMLLLPLIGLAWSRRVPREPPVPADQRPPRRPVRELLELPAMRRLLFVNWMLSSSWDVHSLLVPILGHERGFSASAIGLVLGVFASAITVVRLLIPWLAHRMAERTVLAGAMLWTAAVFALYPFVTGVAAMAAAAAALGLALGAVQPMVMATLHAITPPARQGEAIALRSMTINFSSATTPLLFGALGAAVGAAPLFWLMALVVGVGSLQARRLGR